LTIGAVWRQVIVDKFKRDVAETSQLGQ